MIFSPQSTHGRMTLTKKAKISGQVSGQMSGQEIESLPRHLISALLASAPSATITKS